MLKASGFKVERKPREALNGENAYTLPGYADRPAFRDGTL
jgi:hypothetical protein